MLHRRVGALSGGGDLSFRVDVLEERILLAVSTFTRVDLGTGNGPRSVVVRDFNRDGLNDIIVGNSRDELGLTICAGRRGRFARRTDRNTGNIFPFAMVAGDFNTDGLPDLAIADGISSNITIAINTGGFRFNFTNTIFTTTGIPLDIVTADFDRNGSLDLAAVTDGGSLVPLLGRGTARS